MGWYDRKVRWVRDLSCGDTRIFLELEVRRVDCRRCSKVKRERLDFLADNPLYTKRFAYFVGRRCRGATIKEVAEELALDWHTVKALDQQYMEAQLKRAGTPGPQVIGVDEIAIRKGHTYRIVVSDLVRGRPIWFGGQDRSEASMSQFYGWLGKRKSSRIRLAVMDMWKPFRLATKAQAPQAAILFDKFHVMRHLGEALDAVRKSEYARLAGRQRRYIKGQKYTLLSRKENSVCPRRAQTSLACSALSQAQPAAMAAAGWSWCVSRFRRPTPLASARQRLLKKARIVDLRDEKVRHIGAVNCMAGSKTTGRENHWHHALPAVSAASGERPAALPIWARVHGEQCDAS